MPKSDRVRRVPLVDQAATALDRLSRRSHFTDGDRVSSAKQAAPMDDSAMRRRLYAMLEAAGLPRDSEDNPYIPFRDLPSYLRNDRHPHPWCDTPRRAGDVGARQHHDDDALCPSQAPHGGGGTVHRVPARAIEAAERPIKLTPLGPPEGDDGDGQDDEFGSVEPDEECRRRDSNPRHADYDSRQARADEVSPLPSVLPDAPRSAGTPSFGPPFGPPSPPSPRRKRKHRTPRAPNN